MTVTSALAKTPPNRGLELQCKIDNSSAVDICLLNAWLRVEAFNHCIAEGQLFYSMNNKVDSAVISAGKQGLGAIVIPLPSNVMSQIEERRAGGDFPLRIYSRVSVAQAFPLSTGGAKVLGPPFESQFEAMGIASVEYTIPQSEWIKILTALEWSELELLEFPSVKLNTTPALAQATKRLHDAQDCYRRGDWEESIINCRKAFEAVIKDASGENNLGEASKAFASIIGEGPKPEQINKLAKNFADFLHLARHEQRPPVHMNAVDARLSLHLTGAILGYLGAQSSSSPRVL